MKQKLVNALARDLVEKKRRTLDGFTEYELNKNISNIISKAKLYPHMMEEIGLLYAKGVIDRNEEGDCYIPVPLYKKARYHHFKPKTNGERIHFKSSIETYKKYIDEKELLDVTKLMHRYMDATRSSPSPSPSA